MGGGLLWAAAIVATAIVVYLAARLWSVSGDVRSLEAQLDRCEAALDKARGEVRGLRYRIDAAIPTQQVSPSRPYAAVTKPRSHRAADITETLQSIT